MNPKKSDLATSADWSFYQIPGLPEAMWDRAHWVSITHGVDKEDMLQEGLLFLAVRPETVAEAMAAGGVQFVANVGQGAMLTRAKTECDRQSGLEPLYESDSDE